MNKKCLYLFQNNLRLNDNPSLYFAYLNFKEVIPVLIIPEKANTYLNQIDQNMGKWRRKFLLESALELQHDMKERGIDLILINGNQDRLSKIKKIYEFYEIDCAVTSYPRGSYEADLLDNLFSFGNVFTCEDDTMLNLETLPGVLPPLPDVFTQFRKEVEKDLNLRESYGMPQFSRFENTLNLGDSFNLIPDNLNPNTSYPFSGGESHALNRLNYYLWDSEFILEYKKTRNKLYGRNYSSKLSAYLAIGNISPVQVYHAIKDFESQVDKNDSTYWLFIELLWREYFLFVSEHHEKKIYAKGGIQDKKVNYDHAPEEFEKWCKGETEHPFINANMKELLATGYMSNRGRQNAASYLVHKMKVDWRLGASFFEKHLIDYNVAVNWCNWMYVAGVGNDKRNRVFNPDLQQKKYDPNNDYINLWS